MFVEDLKFKIRQKKMMFMRGEQNRLETESNRKTEPNRSYSNCFSVSYIYDFSFGSDWFGSV